MYENKEDINFFTKILKKKNLELTNLINFLEKLKDYITVLSDAELLILIREKQNDEAIKCLLNSSIFNEFSTKPNTNKERVEFIENILSKIEQDCSIDNLIKLKTTEQLTKNNNNTQTIINDQDDLPIKEFDTITLEKEYELREQKVKIKNLQYIDSNLVQSDDLETIEFIFKINLNKIWNQVLNGNTEILNELNSNEINFGKNLTEFRELFLKEYQEVNNLVIPEGFQYKDINNNIVKPNLMQKLICYRLSKKNRYGNWSGTGSGKTLSAIIASRYINAKLTIIVVYNSTVKTWKDNIKNAFPDSNVITNPSRNNYIFNKNKHNYVIFNYEKYQNTSFQNYILKIVDNNIIDFIVLDEIQLVKKRDNSETSTRRKLINTLVIKAGEKNENLKVLGMTATPVINELSEAKAILEMITGEEYPELTTTNDVNSCISIFKQLTINGLRYILDFSDIKLNQTEIEIDGHYYINEITKIQRSGSTPDMDIILSPIKLNYLLENNLITKGTIIYTQYTTNIVNKAFNLLREKTNYRIEKFTGDNPKERDNVLNSAINGDIDIIIGSMPLSTGVNGLQYNFNKIIFLSLPWTTAEYDQIVGRLCRIGYPKNTVDILIPQIIIRHQPYGEWSFDRDYRLPIIKNKRTISDAAIDGKLPTNGNIPKPETLFENAKIALNNIINRIQTGNYDLIINRNKITVPLIDIDYNKAKKKYRDFTYINNGWYNSNSKNLNIKLTKNPKEWELYHTYYNELKSKWKTNHLDYIVDYVNKRPDWIVADLGCGLDPLRTLIQNKLYSFDHIAINDEVIACDISNTPLEDNSMDVVIFSLSLMGTNYNEYIKEANRILKPYQYVLIVEPKNRWMDKIEELKNEIKNNNFTIHDDFTDDMFIYIIGIKK